MSGEHAEGPTFNSQHLHYVPPVKGDVRGPGPAQYHAGPVTEILGHTDSRDLNPDRPVPSPTL